MSSKVNTIFGTLRYTSGLCRGADTPYRLLINSVVPPLSGAFEPVLYMYGVINARSGTVRAGMVYWHLFGRLENIPSLLSDDYHTWKQFCCR